MPIITTLLIRMKLIRFIFGFCLIPALLCGCRKEKTAPEGPKPIAFSAGVSTQTKALKPDDPSILLTVGAKASIFCTRVEDPESRQIINNRVLQCDEVPDPSTPGNPLSSVWNYNPVEYWEDSGDYYFTGVFPYSGDNISIDNAYYLNVRYLAGSNTDLMVARAYRDASDNTDPVPLEFKHTTSAVRILFGKASDSPSDNYALTDFQLESLNASGTFKVLTRLNTAGIAKNPISPSNWTSGSPATLATWSAESDGDRISIPHPADSDDPDGYVQMGWYYMIPQTLNAETAIRFSIVYNSEEPVETVLNISDRDGIPGEDSWIPNCVYNYYITLSHSGLNLTVKTTRWDEVQVNTDDINFEG